VCTHVPRCDQRIAVQLFPLNSLHTAAYFFLFKVTHVGAISDARQIGSNGIDIYIVARFACPQMSSQGQNWQKDAADQNFDYMFKLLIIGNSSVGKTSFLFRYADDSFTSAFVSTVGIDFKVKTVFRQDKRVKLQIWVRESSNVRGWHR